LAKPGPGTRISRYRLVELLGRGGMGEVWLAEDTQLPRNVAVKLLPPHLAEDDDAVKRLIREAEATSRIDHPAVATVYEAGEHEGRPYIVMQHFDGETLAERLARGPLPIDEALDFGSAVADALAEMHALGIVHRDLKPSNIMLTAHGPRILDFGVAWVQASPRLTAKGSMIGTPSVMSPEQINGMPADNRTDLWALGVLLYHALTGEPPFKGDSYPAVFRQVLSQEPPAPAMLRPEVDRDLDYVVMKLLRKSPTHRYSRAEELLNDLASCSRAGATDTTRTLRMDAHVPLPRLAVLPFEVFSQDKDDRVLANGLVEDLIVDLTCVRRISVASRVEVAGYADRNVPPRTLGRELGVDYVLTGTVRRAGNRARMSAQLVRAADGHILWADRFDRTLEDLFAVQEEVSRCIVQALEVALEPDEREMLGRAPAKNTEAYGLYVKARELMVRSRGENLRAEQLLDEALAIDPEFALAHAALGECYATRGLRWWAGLEVAELAARHAHRALELEPDLADAHYVLMMTQRLLGDPEKVLESIERVLEKRPEDGQTLEWAAWGYMSLDRPREALPILERLTHRHTALGFLANAYEMLGRDEEADRANQMLCDRLVELLHRNPDSTQERSLLGVTLVRCGCPEKGLAQAERAVALDPDDGRLRYNAACSYALAGRAEPALEHLREATKNLPSFISDWPRRDPDLRQIRDLPEFERIFSRA
jgi:non-specific serine/threonine protein kinase